MKVTLFTSGMACDKLKMIKLITERSAQFGVMYKKGKYLHPVISSFLSFSSQRFVIHIDVANTTLTCLTRAPLISIKLDTAWQGRLS